MASAPRARLAAWPAAAAAAFAAAELAAGLIVGRFFDWGRAEALLFLAFRPWLLLAAAVLVARARHGERAAFYLLALVVAGLAEALLLTALGGEPWREMVRGWVAGGMLAAAFDLLVQLGLRLGGAVIGRAAAAAALLLLMILAGGLRPYEAVVLGPTDSRPAGPKPVLLVMTGLPLVWGETGPFDPASRPAAAYRELQHEFAARPIDYLDEASLGRGRELLLAQPRLLEPVELVALDRWVRRGGRALILADPALQWPTRLPLGDARRPPPVSLLAPLLAHWGLRLEPPSAPRLVIRRLREDGEVRRLTTLAEGRLQSSVARCRVALGGLAALCRIGRGRVMIAADADLLHDQLWTSPGPRGAERHARTADNPLVVAAWLDRLAGRQRERAALPVHWLAPAANRQLALLLAALPVLVVFGALQALRSRFTRFSTTGNRRTPEEHRPRTEHE